MTTNKRKRCPECGFLEAIKCALKNTLSNDVKWYLYFRNKDNKRTKK